MAFLQQLQKLISELDGSSPESIKEIRVSLVAATQNVTKLAEELKMPQVRAKDKVAKVVKKQKQKERGREELEKAKEDGLIDVMTQVQADGDYSSDLPFPVDNLSI